MQMDLEKWQICAFYSDIFMASGSVLHAEFNCGYSCAIISGTKSID